MRGQETGAQHRTCEDDRKQGRLRHRKHFMAKIPKAVKETKRLWLTYPKEAIQRPVIYELGHKFTVVTNIRQASVTEEVGIVSLELQGERAEIHRAVKWLAGLGIKVEPVEINVVEG